MLLSEEWKDIPGYEGLYEVSNLGRIRNKKTGRILKLETSHQGYKRIRFSKGGKKFAVHRLVAEAFIPNPQNLPMINHKDEDKTNNAVDNLEYCDCKYNNNYGTAIIRRAENNKKSVMQFDLSGKFIKEFASVGAAAEEIGVSIGTLSGALTGQQKTSKGYLWKYKD